MTAQKDVFVIMPFSAIKGHTEEEWTEIYENIFKPAIEECGYTCDRAIPKTGSLIRSIIERLKTSKIVLADISERNANVFYELGVRHSLSKRTIIVCQNSKDIPSDLRGYWYLQYGIRPSEVTKFKSDIKRIISEIEKNPDRSDSPVSDYLEKEHITISNYLQKENVKKLGALYTELSGNLIILKEMKKKEGGNTNLVFISTDCIRLLLQTLYIDLGPELLKKAYEISFGLQRLEVNTSSTELIETLICSMEEFGHNIFSIRNKLLSGDFEEPKDISTMEWLLIPSDELPKTPHQSFESIDKTCWITDGGRFDSKDSDVLKKIIRDMQKKCTDKNGGVE